MTTAEALENRERCLAYLSKCRAHVSPENLEAVILSVVALREKLERENGDPVTIDAMLEVLRVFVETADRREKLEGLATFADACLALLAKEKEPEA